MTISLSMPLIALVIAAVIALAASIAVKPGCGCANPQTPAPSAPATQGPLRQMRVPEKAAAQE